MEFKQNDDKKYKNRKLITRTIVHLKLSVLDKVRSDNRMDWEKVTSHRRRRLLLHLQKNHHHSKNLLLTNLMMAEL